MEGQTFQPEDYRYRAFISYSRADTKAVDDLFGRLQKFRTPKSLRRSQGDYGAPSRRVKVFLDRRSIQAGGTVSKRLLDALEGSAFLIVICSLSSKASKWVNMEVEAFLEMASPDRILPVFLRESTEQSLEDLMPEGLRRLGDQCPIGADLLIDGGAESVSQKILGAMLGFAQDQIAQEQERADRRQRTIERTALSTLTILSIGAASASWIAYNEARKSEEALDASFVALRQSTPFVGTLLNNGRITTDEASGFATDLQGVLSTLGRSNIRNQDLRYAWGQISTKASNLYYQSGLADLRASTSESAYDILLTFQNDADSQPKVLICDAALEATWALNEIGRIDRALEIADNCRAIATTELDYLVGENGDGARLVIHIVRAEITRASIYNRTEAYSKSLEVLDAVAASEIWNRLNAYAPQHAELAILELQSNLEAVRGETYEQLGRYGEAEAAYRKALDLFIRSRSQASTYYDLIFGIVRVIGVSGSETETALELLQELKADLSGTSSDQTDRVTRFTLAQLYALEGQVLSRIDPASPELNTQRFAAADDAFTKSGAIMDELLRFDPKQFSWRFWQAQLQSLHADLFYRAYEAGDDDAALCEGSCLQRAAELVDLGLETLKPLPESHIGATWTRIELLIQNARFNRNRGWLNAAATSLASADKLLGQLDSQADLDLSASSLKARLLDESADLARANNELSTAIDTYRAVFTIHEAAVAQEPTWTKSKRSLLWTALRLAQASLEQDPSQTDDLVRACAIAAEMADERTYLIQRDRATILALGGRYEIDCA